MNALPLVHAVSIVLAACVPWGTWKLRAMLAFAILYLLPPLVARIVVAAGRLRQGHIKFGSRDYLLWWATLNLQGIYLRFPLLEEVLRLVPGFYSLWLRLWGARIGRLTYWAAGILVLDRPFLSIGDDVVFGAGVRFASHLLIRDEDGAPELVLAAITIGDRAIIGASSHLGPGTEIAADEATRAFLVTPPYSKWAGGVRIRN